jgi:hypothetical protein
VLLDRSYFALQATFAARVVDVYGISLAEAWRLHTAFYALARDNDAGVAPERNNFDPQHPDWVVFLDAVDDGMDPVDHVYQAYLDGDAHEDTGATCFDFTYWPEDRLVRIHFSNDPNGDALRPSTVEDRRRELRSIFQTVAREHPDACSVRGTSWLYHLDAYRRLFPPIFIAGLSSVGYPHQFAALWAQFLDRHGVVKPAMAATFVDAVGLAGTPSELDEAFPLDVLAASTDVDVFYDYLAVDR